MVTNTDNGTVQLKNKWMMMTSDDNALEMPETSGHISVNDYLLGVKNDGRLQIRSKNY